jgi:hypothetical protein
MEYYNEMKIKLQLLLNSTCSNKIHTQNIMKLPTLKDAHMYCKYNNLSGQFTGPVLEKYIKIKYNMTKNNASLCNGDLYSNHTNIEIKASNGGKENNKFNYVQLRMNHNCEYLLTAYYICQQNLDNLGDLYIFKLNKDNMKRLIVKYGHYAHGTIGELGKITMDDLNNVTNQKEYALRPKYKDNCWNELLTFKVDSITYLLPNNLPPSIKLEKVQDNVINDVNDEENVSNHIKNVINDEENVSNHIKNVINDEKNVNDEENVSNHIKNVINDEENVSSHIKNVINDEKNVNDEENVIDDKKNVINDEENVSNHIKNVINDEENVSNDKKNITVKSTKKSNKK